MDHKYLFQQEKMLKDCVELAEITRMVCLVFEGRKAIGPTHDDITSDCVAKAIGVPIDVDPRALAILHEWLKATGAEMSEARRRMTRISNGADLVLNEVSGAPGFWIGNVIVMAGVPSIMQAMLDEMASKPKTGIRMLSESVRANARESDIGTCQDGAQLGLEARSRGRFCSNVNGTTVCASHVSGITGARHVIEGNIEYGDSWLICGWTSNSGLNLTVAFWAIAAEAKMSIDPAARANCKDFGIVFLPKEPQPESAAGASQSTGTTLPRSSTRAGAFLVGIQGAGQPDARPVTGWSLPGHRPRWAARRHLSATLQEWPNSRGTRGGVCAWGSVS